MRCRLSPTADVLCTRPGQLWAKGTDSITANEPSLKKLISSIIPSAKASDLWSFGVVFRSMANSNLLVSMNRRERLSCFEALAGKDAGLAQRKSLNPKPVGVSSQHQRHLGLRPKKPHSFINGIRQIPVGSNARHELVPAAFRDRKAR
jgi:hypothetical protein